MKGLKLRKQVLGADYVERSMAGADEFSMPMQELSTEYCWGYVWTRPGLALRDRSLINIAMISALNRPHELKLHVKAALGNGRDARGDSRGAAAGGRVLRRAGRHRQRAHRARGILPSSIRRKQG